MKTLALIGAGSRGMRAYGAAILKESGRARFVAVAEPDDYRRELFARQHQIPAERCFRSDAELLAQGRLADAILICHQDRQHFAATRQALALGYHILLEKPMSSLAGECLELGRLADRHPEQLFMICHVLRYSPLFSTIKRLLDEGRIGRLLAIQHSENIGYYHFAHSFVRGNWRNSTESSPLVLAKSCHDMDILLWLAGSSCTRVAAAGQLTWFRPENAPAGATARCLDCPQRDACIYSCYRLYKQADTWPANVAAPAGTAAALATALADGPYGRCVYRCDNDVVDHMSVSLEFANAVTATFSLTAFTKEISRTLKLMGSHGEIRATTMNDGEIEISAFGGATEKIIPAVTGGAHGGGDNGLIGNFLDNLENERTDRTAALTSARRSVESHIMAFAAEKARLTGTAQTLSEFTADF